MKIKEKHAVMVMVHCIEKKKRTSFSQVEGPLKPNNEKTVLIEENLSQIKNF